VRGIRLRQMITAAGLALAGVALAGCAGESSLAEVLQSAGAVPVSSTTSAGNSEFNPFAEPSGTVTPARKVIQNPTLADVLKPGPLPEMALGRADAQSRSSSTHP